MCIIDWTKPISIYAVKSSLLVVLYFSFRFLEVSRKASEFSIITYLLCWLVDRGHHNPFADVPGLCLFPLQYGLRSMGHDQKALDKVGTWLGAAVYERNENKCDQEHGDLEDPFWDWCIFGPVCHCFFWERIHRSGVDFWIWFESEAAEKFWIEFAQVEVFWD